MPGPTELPTAPEPHERSTPRATPSKRWQVLAVVAMVVFSILSLVPREMAKWKMASAQSVADKGHLDLALKKIDEALAWSPGMEEIYFARARIHFRARNVESAMLDLSKAIEMAPESRLLLETRAGFALQSKRFELAIQDYTQLLEESREPLHRSELLNGRAYARACGAIDIEAGLEDINDALAISGEANSHYLDTRGFLRYLNGELTSAKIDMETAVTLAEDELFPILRAQNFLNEHDEPVITGILINQTLAVLYHHRGLIYQALKENNAAEEDFRRAKMFGYDEENVF